jgi:hypothetical protein
MQTMPGFIEQIILQLDLPSLVLRLIALACPIRLGWLEMLEL